MTKLLHITDTHPDWINGDSYKDIVSSRLNGFIEAGGDHVIITGDFFNGVMSGGISAEDALEPFCNIVPYRYTVNAGNHDFYGSTFSQTRDYLRGVILRKRGLYIHQDYVFVNKDTVIIGEDGWYDATDESGGQVVERGRASMTDWGSIGDFAHFNRSGSIGAEAFSNRLAKESAFRLQMLINRKVMPEIEKRNEVKNVVIQTHIPPFRECLTRAWDKHSPFYVNRYLGSVVGHYATMYTQYNWLVLCGHTHPDVSHIVTHQDNLKSIVGRAKYGEIYATLVDLQQLW